MLTDRQTDSRTGITKLIVIFRNFANAPKNLNADKRFVQQFSYQCLGDVTYALNIVNNNLNNFSSPSVFTFCWWFVVNKALLPGNVSII